MRQKLFIFLGLIILVIVLVGLNAASYTQKKTLPDSEIYPNRSTYNIGATGTRAFYDLLAETGRRPVRWQEPTADLLTAKNRPATFVVIGKLKKDFTESESAALLRWVSEGGKLVVIDREPPKDLVTTTANWSISLTEDYPRPFFGTDSADQTQMTAGTKAAKPIQPTIYTKSVNAVQPSRFTPSINFERLADAEFQSNPKISVSNPTPFPTYSKSQDEEYQEPVLKKSPTPAGNNSSLNQSGEGTGRGSDPRTGPTLESKVVRKPSINSQKVETVALTAPVVHLTGNNRNLLVDVPFGEGQIVYLSDPYIVSNGGIGLVDNAQLAINIVSSREGTIIFDEYHHGYGTNNNQFFQYFAGTPVIAIFLQIALLVGALFFSQSRRFARPVPEDEPNRLSKLEYVSAMAELQQRTKGYDLAIENIYTDFRRRTARFFGVDNFQTTHRELAGLIAERIKIDPNETEILMNKCEAIMHGEPTGKKEVVRLARRLREIEEKLGLQRRKKSKR